MLFILILDQTFWLHALFAKSLLTTKDGILFLICPTKEEIHMENGNSLQMIHIPEHKLKKIIEGITDLGILSL